MQVSGTQQTHETIAPDARLASGQNMLVKDGCSNHDNNNNK